jgi:hypothetical protein
MMLTALAKRTLVPTLRCGFSVQGEANFLEMVSQYFDKAGEATGIAKDRLSFLKNPDFSLKFNIPFKTGSSPPTQTQDSSRSSRPIECSTRPTDCPPREEPATPAASTSRRSKPSPAS